MFDKALQVNSKFQKLQKTQNNTGRGCKKYLKNANRKYFALNAGERDIMEIRTRIELKAVEIQNENGLTIEKCD